LLQEQAVRLGQAVPSFAEAAGILECFTGVKLDASTVRRLTERAGAVLLAEETAAADPSAQPVDLVGPMDPLAAPKPLFLAVDGAFVPLKNKEWREVKTLVIGVPEPAQKLPQARAEQETRCRELSYFSRCTDVHTFCSQAEVEVRRRQVHAAPAVAGATDGSDWCQTVLDCHAPDAVRILDLPHAAGYVVKCGQVLFGPESPTGAEWVSDQMHRLKHEGGSAVLDTLWGWHAALRDPQEKTQLEAPLNYLGKREELMQYPSFRAAGWPIASSIVESANKLVVERRMKGPGMHWALGNVDPMLTLRNASCSGRWDQAWRQITQAQLRPTGLSA